MTIRLLAISDDPAVPTGFGRVTDHVLTPLARSGEYEVHLCAINYQGDSRDATRYPFRYYLPTLSSLKDPIGIGRMAKLIGEIKPDVVWIQADMCNVSQYYQYVASLASVPVVAYMPVDGDPFPAHTLAGMRKATISVTYTGYGKRVITGMDAALGARVEVIGLGHDPSDFYAFAETKAESKRLAREVLTSVSIIPEDAFIVLRVDKNQERKQWPATLRVFGEFAKRHANAHLWAQDRKSVV